MVICVITAFDAGLPGFTQQEWGFNRILEVRLPSHFMMM